MTSPKVAAKRDRDNRLFARLIAQEYFLRLLEAPCGQEYLAFIRAQATHKRASAGYCYALALREIAGG